jgi:UDP-N-acetylmuramate dehydrogenase
MQLMDNYIKEVINILGKENVFIEESMKRHTSFKIGGIADILAIPSSREQLINLINFCKKDKLNYYIIGNGSNLLVSDKGIRGLVIKTIHLSQCRKSEEYTIECETGSLLSKISNFAFDNSLSGLEFSSGIPGTLGGAIVMNAGAYSGEMKDVVVETEYIDEDGKVKKLNGLEHKFNYRSSVFQKNKGIILSSKMRLNKDDKEKIKYRMVEYNKKRKRKQPIDIPSAGSVFKRPEGYYAGKLIEECGLKGYNIGDAQVSEKHCGFIVNNGNASAEDVTKLIDIIHKTVWQKFRVKLKTEIKFIGDRCL